MCRCRADRPFRFNRRIARIRDPKPSPACCAPSAVFALLALARPTALAAQTRMLRSPDRERDADRVRLREQHLDRRPRRRHRAPAHELPGRRRRIPSSRPTASSIAFSAQYAGNVDVYVVPAEGGEPKRLTWHPGADIVQGWTPDGKPIVFAVGARDARRRAPRRASGRCRSTAASKTPMPLPRAYQGKISPDGRRIAYRMNNSWDEERRNYRGGQNRPIWIVDLEDATTSCRRRGPIQQGHGSGVGRRRRLLHLRSRRRRERLGVRHASRRSSTQLTKFTRLRREDARRRRRRTPSCSSRPATSTSSIRRRGKRARRQHHRRRATSRG